MAKSKAKSKPRAPRKGASPAPPRKGGARATGKTRKDKRPRGRPRTCPEPRSPRWAVVVVSPKVFSAAVRGELTGTADYALPDFTKLILRDARTGRLAVTLVGAGGVLGQVWVPDTSYRLNRGEYKARGVTWVERPNLPPVAGRLVNRL